MLRDGNMSFNKNIGKENQVIGPLLFRLYARPFKKLQKLIRLTVLRFEGGTMLSKTIRRIYRHYHYIDVGFYSGDSCFDMKIFRPGPPGLKIGNYCSIAWSVQRFNADHPMNLRSTHAIFFNPIVGYVKNETIQRTHLTIGNDVWAGHNSTILSTVETIGDGAVIGAGAVLHKNVPPYAIVVGNPARVVRYRFSEDIIKEVQASRWWEKTPEELLQDPSYCQKPLQGETGR